MLYGCLSEETSLTRLELEYEWSMESLLSIHSDNKLE